MNPRSVADGFSLMMDEHRYWAVQQNPPPESIAGEAHAGSENVPAFA